MNILWPGWDKFLFEQYQKEVVKPKYPIKDKKDED